MSLVHQFMCRIVFYFSFSREESTLSENFTNLKKHPWSVTIVVIFQTIIQTKHFRNRDNSKTCLCLHNILFYHDMKMVKNNFQDVLHKRREAESTKMYFVPKVTKHFRFRNNFMCETVSIIRMSSMNRNMIHVHFNNRSVNFNTSIDNLLSFVFKLDIINHHVKPA